MKKVFITLIIISMLITVSCSKDNTNQINEEQLKQLQQENEELKKENETLRQSIEQLNVKETFTSKESKIIANYQEYNKDYSKEDDFKWMQQKKWDKIVIYNLGEFDKNNIAITDKEILSIKPLKITGALRKLDILQDGEKQEGINYYNGSTEVKYVYIFKSGKDTYKIEVLNDKAIQIDGQIYKTDINTQYFAESLIEHNYKYEAQSTIEKIMNSNFCVKKDYLMLVINEDGTYEASEDYNYNYYVNDQLFREIIASITNAMKKIDMPLLSNNINCYPIEELIYYYYGEKIDVDIYHNYINVSSEDKDTWYEMKLENIEYFNKLIDNIEN